MRVTQFKRFLFALGVNWFKRQYATALTTWKYEQTIIFRDGGYQVNGISKFSFFEKRF